MRLFYLKYQAINFSLFTQNTCRMKFTQSVSLVENKNERKNWPSKCGIRFHILLYISQIKCTMNTSKTAPSLRSMKTYHWLRVARCIHAHFHWLTPAVRATNARGLYLLSEVGKVVPLGQSPTTVTSFSTRTHCLYVSLKKTISEQNANQSNVKQFISYFLRGSKVKFSFVSPYFPIDDRVLIKIMNKLQISTWA